MNYKQQETRELASELIAQGYRAFIAASGTYGLYTDAEGSRMVTFQYGLCGFEFGGNYRSPGNGSGWRLETESFDRMFKANPPHWAVGRTPTRLTTLAEHLDIYGSSSKYVEVFA